jgi:hypothetical protein
MHVLRSLPSSQTVRAVRVWRQQAHPDLALFVPPGLWLEIDATQNDSVLIVLCTSYTKRVIISAISVISQRRTSMKICSSCC